MDDGKYEFGRSRRKKSRNRKRKTREMMRREAHKAGCGWLARKHESPPTVTTVAGELNISHLVIGHHWNF